VRSNFGLARRPDADRVALASLRPPLRHGPYYVRSSMMGRGVETDVAPDGSPVEVYLRLPPGEEPDIVHAAVPEGAAILELGCGAGRLTRALVALGHPVVAVDESSEMLRHVQCAEAVLADIETLELRRRFAVVLLASNLVNAEEQYRRAFLRACRRHVTDDGQVLIQRLEPDADWIAQEGKTSERGGVAVTFRDVRIEDRLLSAVAEYRIGETVWRQAFTSRLLDDEELTRELSAAGLRFARILDGRRTWVEARPA
jgi:SAM-dependent methyltransferase